MLDRNRSGTAASVGATDWWTDHLASAGGPNMALVSEFLSQLTLSYSGVSRYASIYASTH